MSEGGELDSLRESVEKSNQEIDKLSKANKNLKFENLKFHEFKQVESNQELFTKSQENIEKDFSQLKKNLRDYQSNNWRVPIVSVRSGAEPNLRHGFWQDFSPDDASDFVAALLVYWLGTNSLLRMHIEVSFLPEIFNRERNQDNVALFLKEWLVEIDRKILSDLFMDFFTKVVTFVAEHVPNLSIPLEDWMELTMELLAGAFRYLSDNALDFANWIVELFLSYGITPGHAIFAFAIALLVPVNVAAKKRGETHHT